MLVRSSIVVAVLAAPAAADVPRDIPGTADDPLVALTLIPEVVDAPLFPGIAIRGGDPEDTKVFFDGFELPQLFHGDRALRSTIDASAANDLSTDRTDVELGHGSSFVVLTPRSTSSRVIVQATDVDAGFETPVPFSGLRGHGVMKWGNFLEDTQTIDGSLYVEHVHGSWKESFSDVFVFDDDAFAGRLVGRTVYARNSWYASAAVSPAMLDHETAIDSRSELRHSGRGAGLHHYHWSAGVDSTSRDVELGWHHDVAAWSWVSAWLSPKIIARGGVRIDAFLRGQDFATQPRGGLEWRDRDTTVKLDAGAYRRPPEKPSELGFEYLHPERTTQVTATLQQRRMIRDAAIGAQLVGYYIDRRRLIARDSFGSWGNTGTGTSAGVELVAMAVCGRWMAYLGASLSTSRRRDFPRGRERPSDFDQPLRIDSMVRYKAKRWTLAARFSLSSGLPYTPIVDSTYDSDADSYEPLYAFVNSERLPWMHSLDVRADAYLGHGLKAFGELRNAYAASTALGYEYSFDYKDRLDVTLPILPFVGITYVVPVRRPTPRTPVIASEQGRP